MTPTLANIARLDRAIDQAMRDGRTELANLLRCERADLRLMVLEDRGMDRLMWSVAS